MSFSTSDGPNPTAKLGPDMQKAMQSDEGTKKGEGDAINSDSDDERHHDNNSSSSSNS